MECQSAQPDVMVLSNALHMMPEHALLRPFHSDGAPHGAALGDSEDGMGAAAVPVHAQEQERLHYTKLAL